MPKLISLLEAGERGEYADLQWFYYYMERSDAMIYSVLQRRRAALLAVDWDIRVVAMGDGRETSDRRPQTLDRKAKAGQAGAWRSQGAAGKKTDKVLADEQVAFLTEVYDRIDNFRDAVSFLFTGLFRGYAHLEKHYCGSGLIHRLEPVEQWFWVRDGMFGDWERNEQALSNRRSGVAIERDDFVVFESVTGGLNRILALLYLRKNLSQKDWDSYLEVYGIPSVFLVGPPNTPSTKEEEYQAVAEQIIADGRGYLPHGSDIKHAGAGAGRPPFRDHLDYIDRQITIAGEQYGSRPLFGAPPASQDSLILTEHAQADRTDSDGSSIPDR